MGKFIVASLGVAAFVGGLAMVFAVAQNTPIGMLDYQPAAWAAIALSFIGLGEVFIVSVIS